MLERDRYFAYVLLEQLVRDTLGRITKRTPKILVDFYVTYNLEESKGRRSVDLIITASFNLYRENALFWPEILYM